MATILNVAHAAAFLGVHPNSIRSYAKAGTIPAVKLGRGWRFIQDDLVAWMRERYPNQARMQPSADQEEAIWHSGTVQEHTTSSSQHLTERSLDVLLARPTGKRPRNITTS